MKTILFGGNFAGANSVLHTRCSRHGVFPANTDAVEEESPGVANYPAILSNTPGCSEHKKTDEHDGCVLNQTPSSTEPSLLSVISSNVSIPRNIPVTEDTNENLTNDDTNDFEVLDGVDPLNVTCFIGLPAIRECCLEERCNVADGEEHITNMIVSKFPSDSHGISGLTLQDPDQHQE